MAKIITFTNQKGGVGKTTSCVNLAAYVAHNGHRTLVVDMDPQGNASSGLGVQNKSKITTIYHCLVGKEEITNGVIRNTMVENLDIIPTNSDLAGAEIEMASMINRECRLKEELEKVSGNYDYIFIDCPPSLGLLTLNSLAACNTIIIPTQCEFYALEGISQLLYTIKQIKKYINPTLEIEGILLTMYDKRSKLTTNVEDEIAKYFPDKLYETTIPRNVRLAEAPSYGLPIIAYDDKCNGAVAYSELATEFLNKNKEVQLWKKQV